MIGMPVSTKVASASSTVAVGKACLYTAQAPATWGAAIDVPSSVSKPPPGTDEVIGVPGANRSRSAEAFENQATSS